MFRGRSRRFLGPPCSRSIATAYRSGARSANPRRKAAPVPTTASRKSGRRDRTARASISGSPDGNGPPRALRNSYLPRAGSGRSQPSCTSAWIAFFNRRESAATPSAVATSSVDTTSCPKISKSAMARDTQRGTCRLASVDGESCSMQPLLSILARDRKSPGSRVVPTSSQISDGQATRPRWWW